MMKIRAHHLLCMQGFQGYGYSEKFSKNMSKIIKTLNSNPKQRIEIITECDEICASCPHDIDGNCQKNQGSHEKIRAVENQRFSGCESEIRTMDIKVLKKLEIPSGSIFEVEKIFKIVNNKLKTCFDVQEICGDCIWKEKCLWFISRSK